MTEIIYQERVIIDGQPFNVFTRNYTVTIDKAKRDGAVSDKPRAIVDYIIDDITNNEARP